jgi:hypothetical protein
MRERLGYLDFLATRSDLVFYFIVLGIVFVFNVTRFNSFNESVLLTAAIACLGYMVYASSSDSFARWRDTYQNFKNDVEGINKDALQYESLFESNYAVHKIPKQFKYTLNHENALAIIESLKFMKRYDDASYKRILMLLEGFFKKYDKVLNIKGTGCAQHVTIMQDIRVDLLNELARTHLGVPNRYANRIQTALQQMQALTYRCIKVASKRCEKLAGITLLMHRPPYAADVANSSQQHNLF